MSMVMTPGKLQPFNSSASANRSDTLCLTIDLLSLFTLVRPRTHFPFHSPIPGISSQSTGIESIKNRHVQVKEPKRSPETHGTATSLVRVRWGDLAPVLGSSFYKHWTDQRQRAMTRPFPSYRFGVAFLEPPTKPKGGLGAEVILVDASDKGECFSLTYGTNLMASVQIPYWSIAVCRLEFPLIARKSRKSNFAKSQCAVDHSSAALSHLLNLRATITIIPARLLGTRNFGSLLTFSHLKPPGRNIPQDGHRMPDGAHIQDTMSFSQFGAATLPKGFRCHDANSTDPKTPEPFLEDNITPQPPPAPRRPRFKLKRRVASSQLNAPTQQFLASVAAADVPIPSIEELQVLPNESMAAAASPIIHNLDDANSFLSPAIRPEEILSLPKTPVPETLVPDSVPNLAPKGYPDWTLESLSTSDDDSSECESSRPSTARSTQTCASIFSSYSVLSDDLKCPDTDLTPFPALPSTSTEPPKENIDSSKAQPRRKRRKAVWTRPMSEHLWSTYLLYLQDPRVTPVVTGRSCIPPQGVCLRVAREAKRSWRGPKPQVAKRGTVDDHKSGGSTPKAADQSGTFLQWPHTCAATRAHLRELCKLRAPGGKQYITRSPAPFGRAASRFRKRRSTPAPAAPPGLPGADFSARDMAVSLTMSTSDSMQPYGPLAQITSSTPEPIEAPSHPVQNRRLPALDMSSAGRQRLASPFMAQSYGPSSTGASDAAWEVTPHRQHQTHGHDRSLQSPPRLLRSRSNTQKRRSRQSSVEPRRTKRPSLGSDLWTQPMNITPATKRVEQADQSSSWHNRTFNSAHNTQGDELLLPRTNLAELFATPLSRTESRSAAGPLAASFALPKEAPPRLGSPFSSSKCSLSFPNRSTRAETLCHVDTAATSRSFATIQRPGEGVPATPTRSLTGRLAYIDERLRELKDRHITRLRSRRLLFSHFESLLSVLGNATTEKIGHEFYEGVGNGGNNNQEHLGHLCKHSSATKEDVHRIVLKDVPK
ncbi:hypothetical protein SODALDRAFT_358166 [Sodiomyces alkalinus F11]|uniref:Uncharacterized protein n=1 Tax=Sodiomyces alkalinus (strain CBS 110278 / VKM F-3762 / F11) TaxID=1314773 RepID=A0A3N2PZ99_SODAK|nr:hypothetical protein SODALDRAFT_358166 [Sodiomyces alkalinus F11]ROT39748.1 hypothetical protein SODALDRAFT_358166 [Sodiomyces alkalinus F11]